MKRLFIWLMIGFSLITLSPAATKLQPGFSFGLKGGLNIADFSGADVDRAFQTKAGFAAGGFLAYRLGNILAIQAEILYTQKGAKIFAQVQGTALNEWLNLNYIEIPLLFKFYPPLDSAIRPMFFAGPYLAFKSSFKDEWEYGELSGNDDVPTFRERETGFAAGGGLDFPVGKGMRMSAEIRYSRGLSTLSKDAEEKGYSSVFAILVGIAFGK
ncbi:MAG: porin family protein [Candidatus Aminicenantes bacterium]|nr:porin family protein [Candidatus Aminicenantes bacterium]